eukprot:TRINITY_DN29384_c0_g1_i1.p1 TRINITY_DN29384_c0_g1~~TRINITY_DN29384_c0_g1_i1.p1  ORF type:complete len:325 (+),score=40.44 TRINITY_DN29384_c0_g1_i1:115-975(+)
MAPRLGPAGFLVVASVAGVLVELQAVRHDDQVHDLPPLELGQSNSSLKPISIDACNALLFTVMSSNDYANRKKLMMVLRVALFEKTGMSDLAEFLNEGLYTIEVEQAEHTGGTNIGRNKLAVLKMMDEDNLFSGAFDINGHSLGWLAKKSGRFLWDTGVPSQDKLHIGGEALSGTCFMIVGSAFIAEAITPYHADPFTINAVAIFDGVTVLTGSGHINLEPEVFELIKGKSINDMLDMFSQRCGETLGLSVGDVLSPLGQQDPEAAIEGLRGPSSRKLMRLTLHGV